ncbi:YbaB/EbfC family nucleoid-associated protein [Hoyosella sp. YIM 151337]|uniref:YbaB/EbfC family nucleoid-associated protein n=1 Tax=Hoyosella sp. YIM 151337 TaxID=2992742 RepID=UPI0022368941|nr:YbaB/EbfC family nucleoid-associated protein [Hoyosella sp. YIM 151337]MCW4352372.1 YbaB/EbfC family nucleoid-associated protein [Hoyosella sp. YIM 151337]
MSPQPEFQSVLARAQRQREALETAISTLQASRNVGKSADGRVVAEIDSSGALVSLVIDESLTRLSPREVANLIVAAAQSASSASESVRRAAFTNLASAFGPDTG